MNTRRVDLTTYHQVVPLNIFVRKYQLSEEFVIKTLRINIVYYTNAECSPTLEYFIYRSKKTLDFTWWQD